MPSKFESRLELWTPAGMVGVLRKAFDVQVSETLNGEYFVQFLYPKEPGDEERYEALRDDGANEVRFPSDIENGQHFRIMRVEEVRDKRRVYKLVEAHHVALTLSQYYLDEYIDFQATVPPETLLGKLGSGTPFTFYIEGEFAPQDVFEWGEKSKIDLLQEARTLYGAELDFDNYDITFTTRKGENRNVSIRYRKNLNGIKRTSHSMERITRLYGYGKNGLTIEGYQGHTVKYIDSEYFDPTNPYMGKMEWPEIEDQGALLVAMQKYLKEHELPKVSYEVDLVELFKVDPVKFVDERIEVGDTVTVYDELLGYAFDARVQQYIRYPFEPKRGSVTLANFREYKTSDYIFQATVGSKKAITYTTKNAVLKGVKYDDSLTLVDGMGMKVTDPQNVERVRIGQIGPGRYGLRVDSGYIEITGKLPDSQIASSANWNGKTTLLTPDGVYTGKVKANQIEAETLSAITANLGRVTAGEIVGLTISGGSIVGASISGGVITGATIQTSATYPRIVMSGNEIFAYRDAGTYLAIDPDAAIGGGPAIYAMSGSNLQFYLGHMTYGGLLQSFGYIIISADNGISLQTSNVIEVPSWNQLRGAISNQTLQQVINQLWSSISDLWIAVNNKADKNHVHTVNITGHNHGIAPGTMLATVGGGGVVFSPWAGGTFTTGTSI